MNSDYLKLISDTDLFVLDMDGTFYLSEDIIPGSNEFLAAVKAAGKRFMFFTNNSSKDKSLYIEKLSRMNCIIGSKDILTSGDITIEFIKRNRPGKNVYLLGTPALEKSFREAGIVLYNDYLNASDNMISSDGKLGIAGVPGNALSGPDIVVVAFDMTLTYEKLEKACTFIRNGAEYLATHPDINCPVKDGFIPDCGAFIACINLSTGMQPKILGKPYGETVDMVEEVSGIDRSRICFVGDRIYTDVKVGVNNGSHGILVMSGETTEEILKSSETKPDAVFDCLAAIIPYLEKA